MYEWLQNIARNLKTIHRGTVPRTLYVSRDEIPPFPECDTGKVACVNLETPTDANLVGDIFRNGKVPTVLREAIGTNAARSN